MIRITSWLAAGSLLMGVFSFSNQTSVHAVDQPLVLIVSVTTPLHDISTALLRRAFLGEVTEYAPGSRLVPINHPLETPPRVAFDEALLSLQPNEVGRFWVDRRIRDQSGPPTTAPSAELAVRIVMSLGGAISYVYPDQLNAKVRALTINGKSHEAADYLLR